LNEILIYFKPTWLESVFHADSHDIFFFNEPKYEHLILIQSSNKLLPFQNGPSAIFGGRCFICDQFVDDANKNKQFSVTVLMFVLVFIWIPELRCIIISYFNIFHP
jgi:hypothetical protein